MTIDTTCTVSSTKSKPKVNVLSELFYERETEFYGMTPYTLLDRIGSIIVDCYFESLNELHKNSLPKSCPFLSETQIAAALTQWSLLVEGTIDKNFELLETYIMKNILALPSDFPIDKFLEEEEGEGDFRIGATPKDLQNLEDQLEQVTKRLESATIRNKRIKGEISLLKLQENSLNHFENHLTCIKGLLQQYKIESFEKNMTIFTKELMDLKFMVTETLAAGSNYLFAKYEVTESVINYSENENFINSNDETTTYNSSHSSHSSHSKSAYKRILTEMASLSAAQSVEQVQNRRKEISLELSEKIKISTISDFEKFRMAIQKLSTPTSA